LNKNGLMLFGYFETDDLKATSKVNASWGESMASTPSNP
jgi:hypothetical protein